MSSPAWPVTPAFSRKAYLLPRNWTRIAELVIHIRSFLNCSPQRSAPRGFQLLPRACYHAPVTTRLLPRAAFFHDPTLNLPSLRQFRITETVPSVLSRLISHPQIHIQLIQIPDSLTSCIQLIPSISNNHSHPDKRNRFSRDSSNALGSDSLGSGGEAGAEISGSCFAVGLNICLFFLMNLS